METATRAAVEALRRLGQSVWIDELSRDMIQSGELERLKVSGVTGITANPTTFDHAVSTSDIYDRDIHDLADARLGPRDILWRLLVDDVTRAADILREVYDTSRGRDGFVSIEVSPDIAADSRRTLAAAVDLWKRCARPNILVKIPATDAGVPAIRSAVRSGVNVNVTLIFSIERYVQVVEAFFSGLEERLQDREPIDSVASVASFFVSRVDTKVDALLKERIHDSLTEEERLAAQELLGTVGVANCKLAYREFKRLFGTSRWSMLADAGAQVQSCLWASTSVKDPTYPPTKYVEALAGADTIDTMPLKTFGELDQARISGPQLEAAWDVAERQLQSVAASGIDLPAVTRELEAEGVRSFSRSYHHLIDAIDTKITEGGWNRVAEAGMESFPASDAPSWGGPSLGPPRNENQEGDRP